MSAMKVFKFGDQQFVDHRRVGDHQHVGPSVLDTVHFTVLSGPFLYFETARTLAVQRVKIAADQFGFRARNASLFPIPSMFSEKAENGVKGFNLCKIV